MAKNNPNYPQDDMQSDRYPDPVDLLSGRIGINRPQDKSQKPADRYVDPCLDELLNNDRG